MSYASITDLSNRIDTRILGDLISDSGVRGTVAGNTILTAILDSAAGLIDSAAFIGQRYTPALMATIVTNAGQDLEYLRQLNCEIAYLMLRRRRGIYDDADEKRQEALDRTLGDLRDGKRVFAVAADEAAGIPASFFPSVQVQADVNLMRTYATTAINGYFSDQRYQQTS